MLLSGSHDQTWVLSHRFAKDEIDECQFSTVQVYCTHLLMNKDHCVLLNPLVVMLV